MVIGSIPDDPDALRTALLSAASCDLIVSTAGVSVGVHDHVRRVLAEIGRIEVWGVAARPGKPLVIGAVGHTPFLGLPGNPVSSAVMFELFARTAIRAMQGAAEPARRRLAVRLGEPVGTPMHLETFLRVALSTGVDGIPVAHLSGGQGSAMLRPLAAADAVAIVPAGVDQLPAGAIVNALELA